MRRLQTSWACAASRPSCSSASTGAYHLPRAVHFDDEVMRIFETVGLSDAIVTNTVFSPGMHFVDSAGKLMLDWSRPPAVTPQGWYLSYRFHQPELEAILRDGLGRWPCVSAMTRCDVFALDEDADGVRVRFEDLSTGRLRACRAKYVVGCDGARSLVRQFMGAGLDDLGFHERWLVLDFLLDRPRDDLGDYSVQFCDPVRPATYVRGVGNRRRWEITLLADENSNAMTSAERIWPLLKRWVTPEDGRIERAAVYTFHSVVARPWRAGRLLLAGNSAHQTPPFFRARHVCRHPRRGEPRMEARRRPPVGRNTDQLLESYESERSPHVRQYIERAVRLGGIINTRNAHETLAALGRKSDETIKFASPKPRLGPGLCLLENDPLAGQLAPQPTLSCGTRLDGIAGYDYVLLSRPGFASSPLRPP